MSSAAEKEAPQLKLGQGEIQRLCDFHAAHFPNQETPAAPSSVPALEQHDDTELVQPEELGYYEDGVRRTLTHEQVRMFRHSEIQRLLLTRRQQREKEEQALERQRRQQLRDADRKPCFDDEAVQQQNQVDTLLYDDTTPAKSNHSAPAEKKFMWPKLSS